MSDTSLQSEAAAPEGCFGARIRRRYERFWRPRLTFHTRGICQLTYRQRDDPPESWRCCELWQRKLANKWNAREFAQRHGCAVPELYWSGRRVRDIPFARLPDRYVIRVVIGSDRRGVLLLDRGRNLFDGELYDEARIRTRLRPLLSGLPVRRLLVEEFVAPGDGCADPIPLDYKVYVFGDRIGAITVFDRNDGVRVTTLDEDWNRLPDLRQRNRNPFAAPPRPACLAELGRVAKLLGTAYESFVRVDLYATAKGPVFGEFAATPFRGQGFSAWADRDLGALWELTFPNRI